MSRTTNKPPSLATAMLRLLADRQKREVITGDLIEEFEMGGRSNLWYWRQVMQTLGQSGARSLVQTMVALAAGIGLVAAVSLVVTVSLRGLLPVVATYSQPVHFAFTFTVLALVLAGTMAGGYLTARLARRAEARYSLLLGAVVALTSFWWLHIGAPALFVGLVFLLTIPAAWVGGYLRTQQKARA
jgi:hypothetical protein